MVVINMEIVIPSKNIYEISNPKIRDNVIERIEVNAVEISPNNEYNTTVYNKDFYETQDTVSNTLVDYEEAVALNAGGDTIRNIRCSCGLKYNLKYITIPEILIPKVQKNKFISKIIDKDDEGNNNIKISPVVEHKIYKGATSYEPSTNSFDFEGGTYGIDEEEILYGLKNLNFQNDVSDEVSGFLLITKPYEVNCTHNFVSNENQLKVSSYFRVNSNNNWAPSIIEIDKYVNADLFESEIFVKEETIDGIDYYRISSIRLCVSASAVLTSSIIESTNSVSSLIGYVPAPATKIVQNCGKVSLTIYGNTIGIDIADKTMYINGETQKKVHSIEGNELMQTSNYLKDSDENAIETMYGETRTQYQNGKETAVIRCSIGNYYDDLGNKVISIDEDSLPMTFSIGDIVKPMIYSVGGVDKPMSLYNGKAKTFRVVGRKPYYNGAVWQELTLQEV